MKYSLYLLMFTLVILGCKNENKNVDNETETVDELDVSEEISEENFKVHPILHASMVLEWNDKTIYVDPTGELYLYEEFDTPDLILITDIHPDHMSLSTLKAINTSKAKIVAPQAVADSLPSEFDAQIDLLNNGEVKERMGFTIEAIPMYNLRSDAKRFHPKGRGNGYVIESEDGMRVYISGDTEDIPEMRNLKDIDVAFVCMNLPYTMTELKAGEAVMDFKPAKVYPYHYRGADGFSNTRLFESYIESKDSLNQIEVLRRNWYPSND